MRSCSIRAGALAGQDLSSQSCPWRASAEGGSCGSAMGSAGWPHQQGQDKGILGKPGLGAGAAISGSWRKGTVVDLSVILFLEGSWAKRLFLVRWWVVFL